MKGEGRRVERKLKTETKIENERGERLGKDIKKN